jgi:hypothetical protein
MVAGATLVVGYYYALNVDCSPIGYATLRVTNAPQHGSVTTTRKGKEFPFFPSNSPYYDCNRRRVDSVLADYRPEAGFTGTDYLTIDAIFPNGIERIYDYQIVVK